MSEQELFERLLLKDREASREVIRRLRSLDVGDGITIDGVVERLIRLVAICLSRRVESDRELWLRWLRHGGEEVLAEHLALRTAERFLATLGAYDPERYDLGTWIVAHAQDVMRQLPAAMAEALG